MSILTDKDIDHILLIDDDAVVHFLQEQTIKQLDNSIKISQCMNVEDSLSLLMKEHKGNKFPNIIFLDINMPKLNGYDFLEAYEKLEYHERWPNTIIIMLCTIDSAIDRKKVKSYNSVAELVEKPLSEDCLKRVIGRHF